jgi:cephalosporin hydroxylase
MVEKGELMWWKRSPIPYGNLPEAEKKEYISRVTKEFHDIVLHSTSFHSYFFGVLSLKPPNDLWEFQELIWKIKPRYFIEIGTHYGGCAYYISHLFELLGKGEVITVDNNPGCKDVPHHPRTHQIIGDSVNEETFNAVKALMKEPGPVMVDIDSCHLYEHTINEMVMYGSLVTPGSYMISEDASNSETWSSIETFLKMDKTFVSDRSCEKFILTFHPTGYLLKL